jgi:glycosyltransferase involved in cell wall biosynthesis
MNKLHLSLIVTTYNRPEALNLVLHALADQTQMNFEVIIADDGSTASTTALIKRLQTIMPYTLQHTWQEDEGFRAARARNRAVAVATGNYLIFLDGDCVPPRNFIANHRQLAEPKCFVVGNRILLSQRLTAQLTSTGEVNPFWQWHWQQWLIYYLRRDINRFLPLLHLPLGISRKYFPQTWQGAKTCNLAIWREDFFHLNGFNENFQGWGHEDAELVIRLLRAKKRRKEGRFAVPVFHLWHTEQDRSREKVNRQRLMQALQSTESVAQLGVDQYT